MHTKDVETLDFTVPDIHGFTPDPQHIGNILTHTGNNNQYSITGFCWLGATDEWGFIAMRVCHYAHTAPIVRPLSHLYGNRATGMPRYQEFGDYLQYYARAA